MGSSANGATRRRARLRAGARRRRLSNTFVFLRKVAQSIMQSKTAFGKYADSVCNGYVEVKCGMRGQLLPLPRACLETLAGFISCPEHTKPALVELANLSVAGINFLEGNGKNAPCALAASGAQNSVLRKICSKWWKIVVHMSSIKHSLSPDGIFKRLVSGERTAARLVASKVDMLNKCGHLDVRDFVPSPFADYINDASKLFPAGVQGASIPRSIRRDRAEYTMLVRRQLRAGKVVLARTALHVGDVFFVAKKESDKLREIWNGSKLSQMAAEPPAMPWLATPASLTSLEAFGDHKVWLSCRDGRVFFDQMSLPPGMQPYFGKPAVSVADLKCASFHGDEHPGQHPLTDEEIQSFARDRVDMPFSNNDVLVPLSACWPMGFAWSSSGAQHIMTGTVIDSGADPSQFLGDEHSLPPRASTTYSVATDDVLCFELAPRSGITLPETPPLKNLDAVWEQKGIISKTEKCADRLLNGTCLGIDLIEGVELQPKVTRFLDLLAGFVDLLRHPFCTKKELASFMGRWQWMLLLNRPIFSCLHRVYDCIRDVSSPTRRAIPNAVLSEITHMVALSCFLSVDLGREWCPFLCATDGAIAYGIGGCKAKCTPNLARAVAAAAADPSCVVYPSNAMSPQATGESGKSFVLPFGTEAFTTQFAIEKKGMQHAIVSEGAALLHCVRRLVKKQRNHGKKATILIDSQALLFSVRKGRTSAFYLAPALRKIAATSLAADLKICPAYVPSFWNPADGASRGKIIHSGRRETRVKRTPFEKYVHTVRKSIKTLRRRGAWPIESSEGSSWWSSNSSSCYGQPSH